MKRLLLILILILGLPAGYLHAQSVFVDAVNGNDANNGTSISTPVQTLDKGRQVADTLCVAAANPIIVALRGSQTGSITSAYTYYQSASLTFSSGSNSYPSASCAGDNGQSAAIPIIYEAYPGEMVAISGGQRITGWTTTGYTCASADCTQYKVNCPQGVSCNFEGLWYNSVRRFKSAVGATDGSNMGTYIYSHSSLAVVTTGAACSLSTNGCNGTTNANCFVFPSSSNCWDRVKVAATYKTAINAAVASAGNLTNPDNGSNTGSSCGIEVWVAEQETYPIMCLRAWDNTNGILIFCNQSGASACTSGNGSFLTSSSAQKGPSNSHRIIITNYLDSGGNKITLPQQWTLDRTQSPPVIYYNAAAGENPNTDTVEIPVIPTTNTAAPVIILDNSRFLIFRGQSTANGPSLVFEHDNYLIPSTGYTSEPGEAGLPAVVTVQSSDTKFEMVGFAHTVGDAIEVFPCRSGVATDPVWCVRTPVGAASNGSYIQHSAVWDIGGSCFNPGGKTGAVPSNTDATVTFNFVVDDTLCDGYSRIFVGAFGFNMGTTHDVFLTHNEVHDGYHAGIYLCGKCTWGTSNSHGDFNINAFFNKFYSIQQGVGNDDGAVHWSTVDANNLAAGQAGTDQRFWWNIIHDIVGPEAQPLGENGSCCDEGLYPDNGMTFMTARYNIIYRVANFGINFHSGMMLATAGATHQSGQNDISNNILVYTRKGSISSGQPSSWNMSTDTTCPAANQRLMLTAQNNLQLSDRYDGSSGTAFFFQGGCADSCGGPYANFTKYIANYYDNVSGGTGTNPLSGYTQAFHVTHVTANPISGCATAPANWDAGTPAQWQGGTIPNSPVVEPIEDAGAQFTNTALATVFVGAGYTGGDNYTIAGGAGITIAGFSAAQTNTTMTGNSVAGAMLGAGRYTNTGFNPVVIETFPTASYDPNHTDNGDY